jgi:heme exporter protein D
MSPAMFSPYAAFILWSYAITAAVVLALIGWVIGDYRQQRATLRDLESQGVSRRSGREPS